MKSLELSTFSVVEVLNARIKHVDAYVTEKILWVDDDFDKWAYRYVNFNCEMEHLGRSDDDHFSILPFNFN